MQLASPDAPVVVFDFGNGERFDQLGEVNQYTSAMWGSQYAGCGSFELFAPVTDENVELLSESHVLWRGGRAAYIIETVKEDVADDGSHALHVKGRSLESLLDRRIVWGVYCATNKPVSTIMLDLVRLNCVAPLDHNRRFPWLGLEHDRHVGDSVTYQVTGGTIYDALMDLAVSSNVGFSIDFDPFKRTLMFNVYSGVDRTIDQSVVDPVVLSSDLEDVMSSTYELLTENLRTVALVAGEGEGNDRVLQPAGETTGRGFKRRELFVDARDLRKQTKDETGRGVILTDEQYANALSQRGSEKLAECVVNETFDAVIRTTRGSQYEYGRDYKLGDVVTVIDERLRRQVSARITEVEEDVGDKYELAVTFGYSSPTLADKVRTAVR